jgi:UPF0271 protein
VWAQVKWIASQGDVAYLKPHGAFYNDTAIILPVNWQTKMRTAETIKPYDMGGLFLAQYPGIQSLGMMLRVHKLPLMGLAATAHLHIAKRANQPLIREGFGDRAYTAEGTLVGRSEPGSILKDPQQIREQVLRLAPDVDSICLHGDTPNCLEFAEAVYKTLVDNGYGIAA